MRNGNLLFSAVQFLMITALFSGGAVFFGLHYLPNARLLFSQWILESPHSFFLLGACLAGTGLFLASCFWMMQRAYYIRIEMKKQPFALDEPLVRKAIGQFWQQQFPDSPVPSEVYFAHQKIEVITEDANYDLEDVEQQLGRMLSEQFGYEKAFFLTFTKK